MPSGTRGAQGLRVQAMWHGECILHSRAKSRSAPDARDGKPKARCICSRSETDCSRISTGNYDPPGARQPQHPQREVTHRAIWRGLGAPTMGALYHALYTDPRKLAEPSGNRYQHVVSRVFRQAPHSHAQAPQARNRYLEPWRKSRATENQLALHIEESKKKTTIQKGQQAAV